MALLGNLKGSAQVFQDTEFYNGVATQSLRFDRGSNTYLTRTPSSASNRKTFTFSCWIKRANFASSVQTLIIARPTSTPNTSIQILDTNNIRIQDTGISMDLRSSRVFRDVSSWYHIVVAVDTTQSTSSNRAKLYINGSQETSFSTETYPTQNGDTLLNNTNQHEIGDMLYSGTTNFDGYMSEINFVDGLALDPTYFGETKNGVWIAKKYTGSYGTNGYRLEFKNTSVGTGSSSTIGADTSGNDNHWTSSGIAAHDCNFPDSPENNFCTLNSVGRRYGQSYTATFSEGNLKAVQGGNATHIWGTMAINQIASQGGVYFEVRLDSTDGNRSYGGLIGDNGVNNKSSNSNGATYHYPIKALIDLMSNVRGHFGTDTDGTSTDLTSGNTGFSDGDIAGFAILSDGKFFCHRNGTYIKNASGNTGNPSTGANPVATIDLTEGDWVPYVGYNSSYSVNFGQDSTFAGQESSGGNQDANGIGDFKYAVPTNCLALCTSNMAEPTIGPNSATQADDHFNTVIFSGTGSSPLSVTGVGFQPDWLWMKRRDNATNGNNILYDSTRGGTNALRSNTNGAESQFGDMVITFASDGFSFTGTDGLNASSDYSNVAWNWKANGGTTSSNSDGTTTSTVQANTTAGFSIITYTGNATAGATIGHGLGKAPKWVITKARSGSYSWLVGHDEIASDAWTDALLLDTDGATSDSNLFWNDTVPNSTVVTLGGAYNPVNGNNVTYVMYAFAEIEGYSKFGSYTGNGSSDGTFVYTGFRPAWVLLKVTNQSSQRWELFDSVRSPNNPSDDRLSPNLSDAEYTGYQTPDFLSNGFKLTSTQGYTNDSGNNYIYIAFAEAPFKYANAR
jgi:hypothetical protein